MNQFFFHVEVFLSAWALSGLGGGTVFGIRRLGAVWSAADRTGDLDTWENVGHVIGVCLAIGVVLMSNSLFALFPVAAGLAVSTAVFVATLGVLRGVPLAEHAVEQECLTAARQLEMEA